MKSKFIKQIILTILGCIVLGCGIGMVIKVGIGADSLSATEAAGAKLFDVTVGTFSAIMSCIFTASAFLLYKKNVGINTILFTLISKFPIDFAYKYFITSDNLFISILLCLLSLVVIALGSELLILSNLGASPYDAFTMSLGKILKHKVKYVYIRWFCDGLFLIIAIILKGEIGIGTILSFALVGTLMKTWQAILEKFIKI